MLCFIICDVKTSFLFTVKEIKCVLVIGSVIKSKRITELLSCRLLTVADEMIAMDSRGGDDRDADARLFKQEFR